MALICLSRASAKLKKCQMQSQKQRKVSSFSKDVKVGSYNSKEGREFKIKNELHFRNSFKFMALSHDKLVSNNNNRIYNKILDRDWFSARLFVT